ncbi:alpha/beta fold hydrolase [Paraburkholderia acidisoli]|uniref:Alpha/beta fold hydrolase n=1 Tax=Paraburkholderia acidisoli TaxID=2571748 RepID=A0A7Z2GLF0_9BURK|nr:alpha/beta fold hydrolase [Paraburkholderia acidisoli]QGZ63962.1 alpha/beta fold hydrolase [Paraburkholderia acidisoli]
MNETRDHTSSPWILLRGLTRESRHWGAFAALLAARDGVVPIDLPGNGTQAHSPSPLNVEDYVDAIRAEALRQNVRAPYRVLAMSLGGMVATAWALRYPHDIARLVLVNTSLRPYSRAPERLRPSAWRALLRVARHWPARDGDDLAETLIHGLTCARRDTLAADLDAWREIRASAPVSRANALRQLAAAARYAARGVPACDVLIVSSKSDRLVNPVCSARLARAWNASHVEHPWAGHDLPHDDPQWLAAALGVDADTTRRA